MKLLPLAHSFRRPLRQWHPSYGVLSIVALGLLSLPFSLPALAQEQLTRVLTVTGEGEELVQTTLSQVSLGVEVQGETAEEAQQEAARRSSAVVEFLRSRNVQRLETTGIRLNPVYNYNNNSSPQITGYTASNIVSFRIPTEQAGDILDEAVNAGATRIDNVSFVAEDAALDSARQQAIREAIEDAQRQAQPVWAALNLTQREIVGIQVNGATPPPPIPMFRAAQLAADEAASTPVIGGEQEVRATVTLQIRY